MARLACIHETMHCTHRSSLDPITPSKSYSTQACLPRRFKVSKVSSSSQGLGAGASSLDGIAAGPSSSPSETSLIAVTAAAAPSQASDMLVETSNEKLADEVVESRRSELRKWVELGNESRARWAGLAGVGGRREEEDERVVSMGREGGERKKSYEKDAMDVGE